jgi:hypothetical protein
MLGFGAVIYSTQDRGRATANYVASHLPRPRRRASRHPGSVLSRGVAMSGRIAVLVGSNRGEHANPCPLAAMPKLLPENDLSAC